jgi:hypothetical protein
MTDGEVTTFRMLGGLAARAGLGIDAAVAAMGAGWELVLGQVRRQIKGGEWGPRTGASTARAFDQEARGFAETVALDLRAGLEAETAFVQDQESVMLGGLDATLDGPELDAAAAAAGLDLAAPYHLLLVVSPVGRTTDVDGAAAAVRELVPHVLDLGVGLGLPRHHRLVVPEITTAQWHAARDAVHDIAHRHRVLVVAPAVAPNLAALRTVHEQTTEALGRTLAACRQWSGLIDPARLLCQAITPRPAPTPSPGRGSRRGGVTPMRADQARLVTCLIDGRLAADQVGAAASSAGLDASREYGLVVLVHPSGRTIPLERAARDVEATIPNSLDLGLTDTLPPSRRLVFPVVTHGRWIEARTSLHDIATKHGVLAIAPIAAPTLIRLAETYRETNRTLRRVVQGCGYTSGIIDPACVGPACTAEGAAPAPEQDATATEAVPAIVA